MPIIFEQVESPLKHLSGLNAVLKVLLSLATLKSVSNARQRSIQQLQVLIPRSPSSRSNTSYPGRGATSLLSWAID